MPALLGEDSLVWVIVAAVLIFAGVPVAIGLGRKVMAQVRADGETNSGDYYLKITLVLVVALACLFGRMFLWTSFR